MNYTQQQDEYSCGPVAIINACKWAKKNISYKHDFNKISKLCKCKYPDGTMPTNMNKTIKKYLNSELKIKYVQHPTLKQIDKHLQKDGAIIFKYLTNKVSDMEYKGHYALIISSNHKTFTYINGNKKIVKKLRKTLKKDLRKRVYDFPSGWFLTTK